ncbi:hypothetical protein BAY61_30155 [Prauserella marina]|uniref:Uncharacterized protein n=1 Tax=Prauserella marina TaxID=530584 RepID=A0A222VX59_9PSEU|nr:hypothetical protein [Prauserella marina]ASR38556.1 hypothetical protein BAY61_30155 [Prauserella marina]PWV81866.1 hypothetical protein DES30_10299 [Prauserella marina]SDD14151.1 hypothetical protein SAMN05421630_10699 [Prauserella marina]
MRSVFRLRVLQAEPGSEFPKAPFENGLDIGEREVELMQNSEGWFAQSELLATALMVTALEPFVTSKVRDFLVRDRAWPRTAIKVKPFWATGKRGLH